MSLIYFSCLYLLSKVVKYSVHHAIFTQQFDLRMLAVEELKSFFCKISDTVLPWFRNCLI